MKMNIFRSLALWILPTTMISAGIETAFLDAIKCEHESVVLIKGEQIREMESLMTTSVEWSFPGSQYWNPFKIKMEKMESISTGGYYSDRIIIVMEATKEVTQMFDSVNTYGFIDVPAEEIIKLLKQGHVPPKEEPSVAEDLESEIDSVAFILLQELEHLGDKIQSLIDRMEEIAPTKPKKAKRPRRREPSDHDRSSPEYFASPEALFDFLS